ncbi:hypothetical protein [Streptomyces sp. NBC_01446]|nr:hypothetical protein [Streptomyces sp. NBC_01446]
MEIDEDGWPPASVESLWAVDLGDERVRLDNTPWFVRGVASEAAGGRLSAAAGLMHTTLATWPWHTTSNQATSSSDDSPAARPRCGGPGPGCLEPGSTPYLEAVGLPMAGTAG